MMEEGTLSEEKARSLNEQTFASEMSSDFDALFHIAEARERHRIKSGQKMAYGSLNNLLLSTYSMTSSKVAGGGCGEDGDKNQKYCTSFLTPRDHAHTTSSSTSSSRHYHNHSSHCLRVDDCAHANQLTAHQRAHSEQMPTRSATSLNSRRLSNVTPEVKPKPKLEFIVPTIVTHLFKRTKKGLLRVDNKRNVYKRGGGRRYDVRVTYGARRRVSDGERRRSDAMTSHHVMLLGALGVGKRAMIHDFLFPQECVSSQHEEGTFRQNNCLPIVY